MSGSTAFKAHKPRNPGTTDLHYRESSLQESTPSAYGDIQFLREALGNHVFDAAIRGNGKNLPAGVRDVLNSGGQPLNPAVRTSMEESFGVSFDQVRIHTDAAAADSAKAMAAKAYTAGSHIVFGAGRYSPGDPRSDRLIAHELTHVIQQAKSNATSSTDAAELEAENNASAALAGQPVQAQMAGAAIQCDVDEDARRVQRQRVDSLRQRIAEIDAKLVGEGGMTLSQEQVDEHKIQRARLSYELSLLQPATPEQIEAIFNPGGMQRRSEQSYANYAELPESLQKDMQKWNTKPPEKPPVFWSSGTLPSPAFRAQVEKVARRADEEHISISAAARKVQHEGPKSPFAVMPADPTKQRHELNRQMMGMGGKPVQDPSRKPSEWEKAEIEGVNGGKPNARNWRTIYNPETGDIVGYERSSSGYHERRNTKGEITHVRESPMTEDETLLTRPDRELTPFERQHVFIKKGSTPDSQLARPIYSRTSGQIIGYKRQASGITQIFNIDGVVVDQSELGLESSPIQADDLLGVASIGKAVGKKAIGKASQWIISRGGEEGTKQAGKRLLANVGKEALEKAGETELKTTGRKTAEEVGDAAVKLGSKEGLEANAKLLGEDVAALGGKETVGAGGKQLGQTPASFSPTPADVGTAAFKSRMARDVENVMRANMRNTIGSGGEAATQASAHTTSMDLNAIKGNFPQLDMASRETFASVKAFGVDKPLDASVIARYDKEMQALRTVVEPGLPTKLGKAADLIATNREAMQAVGSWPRGLGRNATPEQIAKFVNRQGVLAIPADHVEPVKAAIANKARANPAAYGLKAGQGLEEGIKRLSSRVQSLGLTTDEISLINKKVWSNP